MAAPWHAEVEVSTDLAAELIAEQFPSLAPMQLTALGVGWDNWAFLANERWVFRFPRRQFAVEFLEVEARVLPLLAGRLPLPVPRPEWFGQPTPRFRWPFIGYKLLPGRTACRVALDDAARANTAAPLARFLAALHALPPAELRAAGTPTDKLRRLDVAHRRPQLMNRIATIARLGLIDNIAPCQAIIDATPTDWQPRDDTPVHGDLYARHVLLDDHARPCGVIDWGDLHLGDAAVDLSLAHTFLPPTAHAEFRRAYGPIDDATWHVARFKALFTATAIIVYGHDVADAALVEAGLTTLRYCADYAATLASPAR